MANMTDFYSYGSPASAKSSALPAGGAANAASGSPTTGVALGKDIVVAWAITFVILAAGNIAIRHFGIK